ncbi:MAG: MFS transporter, partial [Actinomycetota bacterium]|nr:MFS transporter [Actinomycetota bacterium]
MVRISRPYQVLSLTAIATFLVSLDVSIVVVARGEIEETFGRDQANILTWVFSAYSIAYAAGLLTAGRFADVFGRKRSFLRGLIIFSIGSVMCGFAPSAITLVLARVVQAIGGAQLTPASIALVLPEFPVEKRTQAIAIWGSVGGLAAAIGPSAGGVLVEWWGWRLLFFVNIPFCLFTVLVGRKILHESKDENAQRKVDYPSVVLGFSGVALVVLAISQSEQWGFVDIRSGIAMVVGLILIGGFIRRCQVTESPLLDLSLFKLPFVVASNLSGVLFSVGFIGMWLLNTTWLQEVWDYSVVRSGLATFAGPATAAFIAPFAGKYAMKWGHARVLFAGSVMLSFGTL